MIDPRFVFFSEKLNQLNHVLVALDSAILDDGADKLPAWVSTAFPEDTLNLNLVTRRLVSDIYQTLNYVNELKSNETLKLPGFIGSSQATLDCAYTVNAIKTELEDILRSFSESRALGMKLRADLKLYLQGEGFVRPHFKHITRSLPILTERPVLIGFSQSQSKGYFPRLSIREAEEKLLAYGEIHAHIQLQLNKLAKLTEPKDTPIFRVIREERHGIINANIKYASGSRKSKRVSLPLLFPTEPQQPPPQWSINTPKGSQAHTTVVRSDTLYLGEPFLPTLHAYLL